MIDYSVLINKMIDSYQIVELLGKGGMGAVYKAYDHQFQRWAGLKIINPKLLTQPDLIQQFHLEAEAATGLNHYNIAQLYYVGSFQNIPYYTMEYIEGKSLAGIFKERGRLAGTSCMNYLYQIADGLEYCYVNGVLHRDIKPANIMLSKDGIIKVVDFGLAMVLQEGSRSQEAEQILGTPKYISPESGTTKILDHRSDIYSLGATFYHLIAGEPAFTASTPLELLKKHINEPLIPLIERYPSVPKAVSDIISKMMEKNPKARYQSYTELKKDLEILRSGRVSQTGEKPAISASYSKPANVEKKKIPLVPIIFGSILIAILGIFIFLQQQNIKKTNELKSESIKEKPAFDFDEISYETETADDSSGSDPGNAGYGTGSSGIPAIDQAKKTKTVTVMRQIDTMTAMFIAVENRIPNDIDEMIETLQTGPVEKKDAWGTEIQVVDHGFQKWGIVSAGPDGKWGTRDDMELQNGLLVKQ